MHAVITGDLISSSNYPKELLDEVVKNLGEEFDHFKKEDVGRFALWRGDSFQGVVSEAGKALEFALRLKALVNQTNPDLTGSVKSSPKMADVRLALAVGTLSDPDVDPSDSNEEVFVRSGRALDSLRKNKRTIVAELPRNEANREIDVELLLLEYILNRWSVASAELIYCKLLGMEDYEIAEQLQISVPAVNKRKKVAGWKACARLLERFEELQLDK